jgi:hypothetical protein
MNRRNLSFGQNTSSTENKNYTIEKEEIHIKENNRYSYGLNYGMVFNATVKYISNYISQFYW